jgi:hypothetical protein
MVENRGATGEAMTLRVDAAVLCSLARKKIAPGRLPAARAGVNWLSRCAMLRRVWLQEQFGKDVGMIANFAEEQR